MALLAVTWTYTSDADLLRANQADHGAFIKDLAAKSILVEAGAWADGSGALLVLRAANPAEVEKILSDDPYIKQQVVTFSAVHEWKPVLGAIA